jgi:exopolysaccharide biosynthesis polyprenyl glycosylphosphotransferase
VLCLKTAIYCGKDLSVFSFFSSLSDQKYSSNMLKKHSQFFIWLLMTCDLLVLFLAWLGAYWFRKNEIFYPLAQGLPDFHFYLKAWPLVALLCLGTFSFLRLYQPRRDQSFWDEFWTIVQCNLICWLFISAFFYYYARTYYSRVVMVWFSLFNTFGLVGFRFLLRSLLRFLRRKGFNRRSAIIIGSGRIGQKVVEKLKKNSWMGIYPVGFFDPRPERQGKTYSQLPVLGLLDDLPAYLKKHAIDHAYIALPMNQNREIEKAVMYLSEETLDVRLVPDMLSFMTMHHTISNLDGLPIVSLTESPLYGWRRFLKRLFDLAFSAVFLLLLSPLLLLIAVLIKTSSPGPIFYRQVRMGLDGKLFHILKFRSMCNNAEKTTGAIWSGKQDSRVTWIGKFLRKSSLDEVPQFWNVFVGEMSIVGPRPERPEFIEDFKKQYRHRRYMHRHKMKAGITGLAQVHGWRGSGHPRALVKRLQYDLKYIKEWSLFLDFKIMLKTPLAILQGDHPHALESPSSSPPIDLEKKEGKTHPLQIKKEIRTGMTRLAKTLGDLGKYRERSVIDEV